MLPYDYSRKLPPERVLVHLDDRQCYYPTLSSEIRRAGERYGFTFSPDVASLHNMENKDFVIRHAIILDGLDDPFETTDRHIDTVRGFSSATLAISYTSQDHLNRARPSVERLKKLHGAKLNYLLPVQKDAMYLPSLEKLVDNAVCDSVRVKYIPDCLDSLAQSQVPNAVRSFFVQCSRLIEEEQLFHRASTDGYIAITDGEDGFYITCTRTDKVGLDLARVSHVLKYDRALNVLSYRGGFLPSSDSVEAAIVFQSLPSVKAILHTHASDLITRNPAFRSKIGVGPSMYGVPELGDQLVDALKRLNRNDFLIMQDHGELFVTDGQTPTECFSGISNVLFESVKKSMASRHLIEGTIENV